MSFIAAKGKITPLHDSVLVADMEFENIKTHSGIFIPNQNGKTTGIKPRWGKVYAVGPKQQDVKVGEWVYVEHGRWTRGATLEDENGVKHVLRRVENKAILLQADEPPNDFYVPE